MTLGGIDLWRGVKTAISSLRGVASKAADDLADRVNHVSEAVGVTIDQPGYAPAGGQGVDVQASFGQEPTAVPAPREPINTNTSWPVSFYREANSTPAAFNPDLFVPSQRPAVRAPAPKVVQPVAPPKPKTVLDPVVPLDSSALDHPDNPAAFSRLGGESKVVRSPWINETRRAVGKTIGQVIADAVSAENNKRRPYSQAPDESIQNPVDSQDVLDASWAHYERRTVADIQAEREENRRALAEISPDFIAPSAYRPGIRSQNMPRAMRARPQERTHNNNSVWLQHRPESTPAVKQRKPKSIWSRVGSWVDRWIG